MELFELKNRVNSKETFLEFIQALRKDWDASQAWEKLHPSSTYGPSARGWENPDLGMFLESMYAWTQDSDEYVPSEASWRTFAEILLAAKSYE
jgi:hypothetical protein